MISMASDSFLKILSTCCVSKTQKALSEICTSSFKEGVGKKINLFIVADDVVLGSPNV